MQPVIVSVNVGRPIDIQNGTETWRSGIFKSAVSGPVRLAAENLDGDQQADLRVHGGPDKAVCVYSADHYPYWREQLGVQECGPGWFGENFSVEGQNEGTVSIGDTFRVGTAIVQVSQPRAPCSKLGRRWNRLDMPKLVIGAGRTGWYLRVVEPGQVERGQHVTLLDRPFERWTIEAVNDVAYSRGGTTDAEAIRELSECPVLAEAWRAGFKKMMA